MRNGYKIYLMNYIGLRELTKSEEILVRNVYFLYIALGAVTTIILSK